MAMKHGPECEEVIKQAARRIAQLEGELEATKRVVESLSLVLNELIKHGVPTDFEMEFVDTLDHAQSLLNRYQSTKKH